MRISWTVTILMLAVIGLQGAIRYTSPTSTSFNIWNDCLEERSRSNDCNNDILSVLNANDDGPFSLRDAVRNAMDGDIIVFTEFIGDTIRLDSQIIINNSIEIVGIDTSQSVITTTVDERIFTIEMHNDVRIINLSLVNGPDDIIGSSEFDGGAIHNSGNLVLDVVCIKNNVVSNSTRNGGGIWSSGPLSISNAFISGNAAIAGGGIYALGPLMLDRCEIRGNRAYAFPGGAGVYVGKGATIRDCKILDNNGGVFGSGGGICCNNVDSSRIVNTVIAGNNAANGGGIYCLGNVEINSCVVSGNYANMNGGGALLSGKAKSFNSTWSGNQSGIGGGLQLSNLNGIFRNNIIAKNYAQFLNNDIGATNSIITEINNIVTDTSGIGGVFTDVKVIDPAFIEDVDTSTIANLTGNLRLSQTSYALHRACDTSGQNLPPFDIDGNPRARTTVDMGAFENPLSNCPSTLTITKEYSPISGTYEASSKVVVEPGIMAKSNSSYVLSAPEIDISADFLSVLGTSAFIEKPVICSMAFNCVIIIFP